MQSLSQLIDNSTQQLQAVSESSRLDVELLLCSVLKKERSFIHAWPEHKLTLEQLNSFQQQLEQRIQGMPIAHIIGERGFWSLNLKVTKDTLIPRPDTERLVELALERIPNKSQWKILDLGTGTGAIALSLAIEHPESFITATDQFIAALDVAKQNARDNKILNIKFLKSDWFSDLKHQQFDMIVSNPPYIKENDPHLQQGDVRFEPLSALTSGEDGLDDIRIIISSSLKHLTNEGFLLIEHGYDQAGLVCDLLKAANFTNVCNFKDDNDVPRVSIGKLSNT